MTVIVHSPLGGGGERPHPPPHCRGILVPREIQQLLANPLHQMARVC